MGVEWHTVKFLLSCAGSGVSFRRTLTLGHQQMFVPPQAVRRLFAASDVRTGEDEIQRATASEYADDLLRVLGAAELVTLDASPYEGATVVHDMNQPLAAGLPVVSELRGQFDVVLDGGTIEHVFNFPVAIKNAMELVRVGGHLLIQTPTNNYSGHGFYQFSPELFYRLLCEENGYRIERMIAFECYPHSQWYEVVDPAKIRARVELVSTKHKVLLLIRARRTREADILRTMPQQSDYVASWGAAAGDKADRPKVGLWQRISSGLKRRIESFATRHSSVNRWQDARANDRCAIGTQPHAFRAVHE